MTCSPTSQANDQAAPEAQLHGKQVSSLSKDPERVPNNPACLRSHQTVVFQPKGTEYKLVCNACAGVWQETCAPVMAPMVLQRPTSEALDRWPILYNSWNVMDQWAKGKFSLHSRDSRSCGRPFLSGCILCVAVTEEARTCEAWFQLTFRPQNGTWKRTCGISCLRSLAPMWRLRCSTTQATYNTRIKVVPLD